MCTGDEDRKIRQHAGKHFLLVSYYLDKLACVASVSVEFGSKERPRNGVFGILPARKMGPEPKKER